MQKIGFIYTKGRKERLPLIKQKKAPADFFYGALELKKRGYEVDIIDDKDIPQFVRNKIFVYLLARISAVLKININLLFRLNHRNILSRLNNLDMLVATTNSYGLVLGTLKLMGRLKTRVLFLSMGAFFPIRNPIKKFFYKKLLAVLIVAPESNKEFFYLQKEFPDMADRFFYLPFGVDHKFWFPLTAFNENFKDYVLSIGNSNRDYSTLISAWKSEYPLLKIVTNIKIEGVRSSNFQIFSPFLSPSPSAGRRGRDGLGVSPPLNVQVIRGDWKEQALSDIEVRELMQKCFCVIIPFKESERPFGQSVCLQAMACGKAVIMSAISGLDKEDIVVEGKNCLLAKPYSVNDMQEKFEMLLNNPSQALQMGERAREKLVKHYTIKNIADGIERIFQKNIL